MKADKGLILIYFAYLFSKWIQKPLEYVVFIRCYLIDTIVHDLVVNMIFLMSQKTSYKIFRNRAWLTGKV